MWQYHAEWSRFGYEPNTFRNMNAFLIEASDAVRVTLGELVDVATQTANRQIDALTTRIAEALQRTAADAAPADATRCLRAAELLRKNRYPFYYVTASRLAATLESAAGLGGAALQLDPLPPDLEVDKKLCLIKAGQSLEKEYGDLLARINSRLAVLLGREAINAADNPFHPRVFLNVLHEAWCEFQPEPDTRPLLYPLLGTQLGLDMGPILHAIDRELARRGAHPQTAKPATVFVSEANPVSNAGIGTEDTPLLQKLRKLFPARQQSVPERSLADAFPALFQDEIVQRARTRRDLLDLLTRMQGRLSTLLPGDLRREAPGTDMSPEDDAALALVARIFTVIRSSPHLPERLREAILSLHLPVLKVVLGDHEFFLSESHPARRTIELLVRLALGWDPRRGENDPVYPLFMRSIARIAAEADSHIGVFAEVAVELEAFAMREQTGTEQALAQPIAVALKKEKRLQAQQAARQEVALRIGTGEVDAFVEAFLEQRWVPVLTLAHVARDEKPHAFDSALRTMDELVWSIRPKNTAEDRAELLARLPPMLAMLNKWLDAIKWNDDSRARFFADLARCHASLVRAPLETSPQRLVELAIEAAQKAAERREMRRAAQQPEPPPDAFDDVVAGLRGGAWLVFRQADGGVTRLRLAWVSPMRNLYLFATREHKEAMTLEAAELASLLREQQAQVVPAAGLVGHALSEALNDPSQTLTAA